MMSNSKPVVYTLDPGLPSSEQGILLLLDYTHAQNVPYPFVLSSALLLRTALTFIIVAILKIPVGG